MEAAAVASDASRRAARLARAQDLAADVVRDAEAAARDAAAVSLEAQAKAGELLREKKERGERERTGRAGDERVSRLRHPPRPSASLA